ncbi:uncharacterized protein EI90DRAFT_3019301 [Cantharellus anzutake]|uniref:uncharacterized protein n=1 Tax=Cantharellus anzutake TaxID=1750568 RepID=UPI0019035E20|nr:uncharacterized protein EI90DRAFT_3019301 [Cantharellus anzutake]KAF8324998.1 hypothetical protein EI90DRAFT_3019301 [Cantharellus anzutake]
MRNKDAKMEHPDPCSSVHLAYSKEPHELESLKLDKSFLGNKNCHSYHLAEKLHMWDGQTLIVIFGKDSPSSVAKMDNLTFKSSPNKGSGMTALERMDSSCPISLLYEPFGYFCNIHCGVKVPGEEHILEDTEELQCSKFNQCLEVEGACLGNNMCWTHHPIFWGHLGRENACCTLDTITSYGDPTGEEFHWDLFLAFKAAALILSKIKSDVKDFLKVLTNSLSCGPAS